MEPQDTALWSAFLRGDEQSAAALIKLYYNTLINYGNRFCTDKDLVKDSIQDLFLYLWANRATLKETQHVKFYILKAYRRRLLKEVLKSKKYVSQNFDEDQQFDLQLITESSAENQLIDSEYNGALAEKMKRIVSMLSRRQQEIIYLKFYLDTDQKKIADIMGLSQQAVYNLLYDALKKLRLISKGDRKIFFSVFF